jgi:hypothetical protein
LVENKYGSEIKELKIKFMSQYTKLCWGEIWAKKKNDTEIKALEVKCMCKGMHYTRKDNEKKMRKETNIYPIN